jgi:hypothetical protein
LPKQKKPKPKRKTPKAKGLKMRHLIELLDPIMETQSSDNIINFLAQLVSELQV